MYCSHVTSRIYKGNVNKTIIEYKVQDCVTKSFSDILSECKHNIKLLDDSEVLKRFRNGSTHKEVNRTRKPTIGRNRNRNKSWSKCCKCNFKACDNNVFDTHDCSFYLR